jgi:peptidyl-tRNA hydrolase, PTH1 family
MFLIIGLGNPGEKYENTRHNLGFEVINKLRETCKFPNFKFHKKSNAFTAEGQIENEEIILAEPQTFMNLSGSAAPPLIDYYHVEQKGIVIIHDDIDIPFGKIRISKDSGSGGHKGVSSFIENLGTKNFIRIRIGILPDFGKPEKVENFVLKKFTKSEEKILEEIIKKVIEAIEILIKDGLEKAMNEFNQ